MARGTWGTGLLDTHVFKVNIRFTRAGSKCQTGFKVRDLVTNDQSEQNVADAVRDVLEAPFRGIITPRDTIDGIDVQLMGQDTGAFANPVTTAGGMAVSAAEELPSFVNAVLSFKSEIRKRYGQGRMFIPVAHEGMLDANAINSFGQSLLNGFITPLTTNFTGSAVTHDLRLVTAHQALPERAATVGRPMRPAIPASWYDVGSIRLNTLVTTLRSRKAGVGS